MRKIACLIATALTTLCVTSTAVAATPLPSQVLDLTNWKLTLPIDANRDGVADEIKQPALSSYSNSPFFCTNADATGVSFRAYAGGATTSGSSYPRSELREMTNNGSSQASWSSTAGTHVMTVEEALTGLSLTAKPQVVMAQIHNSSDDVVEVLYDGFHHAIAYRFKGTESSSYLLTNYKPGARFTLTLNAHGGHLYIYVNGALKATRSTSQSGLYFKAGSYVQSNPSKGDSPNAYGEVTIYRLAVTHT